MSRNWKNWPHPLWLASCLASLPSAATQVVDGHACASGHAQVTISALEQNRLAVDGRRIASVVPSQKDVLATVKDEELGVLYFALANPALQPGSITLFVTDDQRATCKLILTPGPIAGDDIVIRPAQDLAGDATPAAHGARTLAIQRRVKALVRDMAAPETGPARARLERLPRQQSLPLWKEAQLDLTFTVMAGELVGEHYRLTNTSPSILRLAEAELYRKGVLAVAIDQHELRPQEATAILIVRERSDHE